MTGKLNADRLFGIGFVVAGIALLIYSQAFNSPNLMGDVGPGFLPGLVGVLLAVLGGIQAIKPRGDTREQLDLSRIIPVAGFCILTVIYALAFMRFGFSWASMAFMTATMVLLGKRTVPALIGYVAGSAFFVFLVGWVLLDVLTVPLRGVWLLN